ncbi:MAG TPA: GHKL domain-containing protein [Tissierellia bacterium]|nr:GHKL domain-containing protein [Tissierellia bacterium]
MDIKLRDVSRRKSTKIIVSILSVIFITAGILLIQYLSYTGRELESMFVEKYKDSNYFYYNDVLPARNKVMYLFTNRDKVEKLPDDLDYYYYVSDGETVFTNVPDENEELLEEFDEVIYSSGAWTREKNTDENYVYFFEWEDNLKLILTFHDEYMAAKQEFWENSRKNVMPFAVMAVSCFVLAFGLGIYLMAVTGRSQEDDELHMWRIDKTYTEIQGIAAISIFALWLSVSEDLFGYRSSVTHKLDISQIYSLIFSGILTIVAVILLGVLSFSMIRKLKAKTFLKQSITYTVYFKVKDFLKSLFDGRRYEMFPLTKALFYRQLAFIIVSFILVVLTFLFLFVPPLVLIPPVVEIAVIYWYVKYNNITYDEINEGFDVSLKEQMKSERMKVELITNVSHDLKTPLTSIISYIDLLSKEEGLSETARDYVNILREKSYRLKNIVSDLFDLAKSTSGDINLDMEKLDLKKLIEQTLGDMEDDIKDSGLQIKTRLPAEPVYIMADGKRLYRVFQNLIDNALKYSLKGTRVYIELEEANGKAIASIKNISGYEMNFTTEEILQRFARGDKARSTDGSGLGLSIAESFTRVCGGDFRVDIDGDLFKVTVKFNVEK